MDLTETQGAPVAALEDLLNEAKIRNDDERGAVSSLVKNQNVKDFCVCKSADQLSELLETGVPQPLTRARIAKDFFRVLLENRIVEPPQTYVPPPESFRRQSIVRVEQVPLVSLDNFLLVVPPFFILFGPSQPTRLDASSERLSSVRLLGGGRLEFVADERRLGLFGGRCLFFFDVALSRSLGSTSSSFFCIGISATVTRRTSAGSRRRPMATNSRLRKSRRMRRSSTCTWTRTTSACGTGVLGESFGRRKPRPPGFLWGTCPRKFVPWPTCLFRISKTAF